jgi:hypothetical protein
VLAWREALNSFGIDGAIWRIHRRIGMSGGLFVTALRREIANRLTDEQLRDLAAAHADAYGRLRESVRPPAVERSTSVESHGSAP